MKRKAHVICNALALEHNLKVIRLFSKKRSIIAMLKSNAYGHGLDFGLAHLRDSVDGFAVAFLSEALYIRKRGYQGLVLVLQGVSTLDEQAVCDAANITVVVHALYQYQFLSSFSSYWLKINTGMNRLGLKPQEWFLLQSEFSGARPPRVLMTHLATADEVGSLGLSVQLKAFQGVISQSVGFDVSVANSAAILTGCFAKSVDSAEEWVRPGLALYGASPFFGRTALELGLHPVMSFIAPILSIYQVAVGESVGYGFQVRLDRNTLLGVVAAGYADGYPRMTPDGSVVYVNGVLVRLLGRVSMDMIAIDLTDLSCVKVGDWVELWGENVSIDKLSNSVNTLAYELLVRAGSAQAGGMDE